MLQRIFPFLILLVIAMIGFIYKHIQLKSYSDRLEFCYDYQSKFIDLINIFTTETRIDEPLYCELTEKVSRMQNELGRDGRINMVDRLMGIQAENYQFLVNFLPEIRQMPFWRGNSISQQRFMSSADICNDMFIRHIGRLKEAYTTEHKLLFNPFSCLADGVRWLLWFPANILLWCGFISRSMGQKLCNNLIVKVLTFLITIMGLISSVITIFIGWEEFVSMIQLLIPH